MISYPIYLPDFKTSRLQAQNFNFELQGFRREMTSYDYGVQWNIEISCTSYEQSRAFDGWVDSLGSQSFVKTIITEYGALDYECRFIEWPLEPIEINNVYRYTAAIISDRLKTDMDYIDRELVDRYKLDASIVDVAINSEWPEVAI